jgi:uncharacterized membrane protein
MKSNFWVTAVVSAIVSFFILMGTVGSIIDRAAGDLRVPPARVKTLGYQVAGVLVVAGLVGLAIGIRILKKKPGLAAGLSGFFSVWVILGIITFFVGP